MYVLSSNYLTYNLELIMIVKLASIVWNNAYFNLHEHPHTTITIITVPASHYSISLAHEPRRYAIA